MAKSQPTSVRHEIEKFDLVKTNEGLETVQQVYTFLLDKYWWEHKIGTNPVSERNELVFQKPTSKKKEPRLEGRIKYTSPPLYDSLPISHEIQDEFEGKNGMVDARINELQEEISHLDPKTPLGKKRIEWIHKKIIELTANRNITTNNPL